MGWKDWSYPIKGIIIGLGIGIVCSILGINCLNHDTGFFVSSCISYVGWAIPMMLFLGDVLKLQVSENMLTFISVMISGPLYGWILGLIIGKASPKKESAPSD